MLVLGRKIGERIGLRLPDGEVVWVTLTATGIGRGRIGIEAPRSVAVFREDSEADYAKWRESLGVDRG